MRRPNYAEMGRAELVAAAQDAYDVGFASGVASQASNMAHEREAASKAERLLAAAIAANGGSLRVGDIHQAMMDGPRRPCIVYDGSTRETVLMLWAKE